MFRMEIFSPDFVQQQKFPNNVCLFKNGNVVVCSHSSSFQSMAIFSLLLVFYFNPKNLLAFSLNYQPNTTHSLYLRWKTELVNGIWTTYFARCLKSFINCLTIPRCLTLPSQIWTTDGIPHLSNIPYDF
jgi:hypothetical protein